LLKYFNVSQPIRIDAKLEVESPAQPFP